LSYIDYGAPILQSINHIIKLEKGEWVINNNELSFYKDRIATLINKWITNTTFLLISDGGKYNGSNIYAAPSQLYKHYTQAINSCLIGSPFANIINNMENIKKNIEDGKQQYTSNKLGKQFIESVIENNDIIADSIMKAHPYRKNHDSNHEISLFHKGDMLTIFVSISGNIENNSNTSLFYQYIDPAIDNTSSFKRYIINNTGDRIKPLIYAIIVPLIDDYTE
jgi:hypothetical protein